jgi:molybdopterin-containing oxidoreductase family iron-sulfur binding subunit
VPDRAPYDIVRAFWSRQYAARSGAWGALLDPDSRDYGTFERFWRRSLHDGLVAGSALPERPVTAADTLAASLEPAVGAAWPVSYLAAGRTAGLEIIFKPDPTIGDGRQANNGWLQELPKPLLTITWDNAAQIAPATAERLGLTAGDVVELRVGGRSVRAPVWIAPGHPAECVTVHLGYGRTRAGRVGTGLGYDAYRIRRGDAPWVASGLEIRRTTERRPLAATQSHHSMEGRHLVRTGSIQQYRDHPEFVHELGHDPAEDMTMYPPVRYSGHKWGLAIDLNACTGCNACVVGCQAENNIPIVGRDQVLNGREMHWIRVDRYYEGDVEHPAIWHQPVPCMHCENAPCEVVCPVAATVHSAEGLNDMVYNRCVGTRYCANNCPYKVRRFNFLLYADFTTPSLKLARNPDVTVRSRGVMEKCTYCVQRINQARIDAGREGRSIRDGDIQTACQAVCPAQAIVFGDLNDPDSAVSKLKAEARNYGLLTDLNTRPRTTYLAALRNPNPEIEEGPVEH